MGLCVTPALAQSASGSDQPYREIPLPVNGTQPLGITVAHDGTIWFAGSGTREIFSFNPETGQFANYKIPGNPAKSEVWGMTTDNTGNIWFGDTQTNTIKKFSPISKQFQEYPIPTGDSYPFQLRFDSSGILWFTELYGGKIGELDPAGGIIREYDPPTSSSGPSGLDFDSNGTLWFAEGYARKIGSYSPSTGDFLEWDISAFTRYPRGIAVDKTGRVWVADSETSIIAVLTPSTGMVIPYATPDTEFAKETTPYFLVTDRDGSIWLNERIGNTISRFSPVTMEMTGVELPYSSTMDLADYTPPPCCKTPTGMPIVPRDIFCIAPDNAGNLWFTETFGNKIGMIRGNYIPQFDLSARRNLLVLTPARELHEVVTIESHSPDNSRMVIFDNYPEQAEFITVGPLLVDPGTVKNGVPFPIDIHITAPAILPKLPLSLTVTVRNKPITRSVLFTYVSEGSGGSVPGREAPRQSGIAEVLCFGAITVAAVILRRWR